MVGHDDDGIDLKGPPFDFMGIKGVRLDLFSGVLVLVLAPLLFKEGWQAQPDGVVWYNMKRGRDPPPPPSGT